MLAPPPPQHGFSLVELSIVLVILGLLAGGVLTGRSLIRASELRATSTEYSRYVAAMHAFRQKYFMLPGDLSSATSFWGGADANPSVDATCRAINTTSLPANSGTATCNGNGDGMIMLSGGQYAEQFRFWQHLANAGMVEGSYTGYSNGASGSMALTAGTNVPSSKLTKAVWFPQYVGPIGTGHGTYYADEYKNLLYLGAIAASGQPDISILKPEEAWNIDTKLDDGKPGYGLVKSLVSRPNCTTTVVQNTAEYALSTDSIQCVLVMRTGL